MQADLDRYMVFYNRQRAHQGYRTQGRTPYQAFLDGIAAMQARDEVRDEVSETLASNSAAAESRFSTGYVQRAEAPPAGPGHGP